MIRRLVNLLMKALIRVGIKPGTTCILSVPGRKTGRMHSTPVTLVEDGNQRWLVAPYGPVNWVKNARAAGRVKLTRGRASEIVSITELGPQDAAPVLKRYVERVPVTRPYFDCGPDDPAESFVAEAADHPVFRLG